MAGQRTDQEMGAVLIAVNSYRNYPKRCLPYTDRVLKGYIETFYRYLFFHVDVLVDFTQEELNDKFEEFTARCQKHKMTRRIAVVLYGHGGVVEGKECILANDMQKLLPIAAVEDILHSKLPEDCNKYLFIDTCREFYPATAKAYVFQANTSRTIVVRSTLLFKAAIAHAWSESFAMNLRKQGTLLTVVKNVDLDMSRRRVNQKSEITDKGALDSPDFQGEARAHNGHNNECIRPLKDELQEPIKKAEESFAEIRTQQKLPSKPDVAFLDSPPNSPSNQPAQHIGLSIVQANLPLPNPPVPYLGSLLDSPSNQPSAQGTQPSSTSSTQAMAGVTSTSTTGLDAVITSVDEILIQKYKNDMIAQQKLLGTVLRLGGMTDTILQGPNALNYTATLTAILETWMQSENQPQVTWRDLVTALERQSNFNRLVCNIKEDHAA